MKNKIRELVIDSIKLINESIQEKIPLDEIDIVMLFGLSGVLDSISLVKLVVTIEEQLDEQLGLNIILANEKAMSQKNSPFANLDSLTNYICLLIEEEFAYE